MNTLLFADDTTSPAETKLDPKVGFKWAFIPILVGCCH